MSEGEATEGRRCGFIAIVGAPNAGKSTLVNVLVGTKVTIVSPKVQTTRTRVLGIVMAGAAQVVLVDTPGIFAPKRRLERAMVAAAWTGAADADLIALVVDAARGFDDDTRAILARLKETGREAVLILNKVDLVRREKLLGLAAEMNETGIFARTFMVSALSGDGVGDVLDYLAERMPPGPWLFPEDQISDMPLRLLAAEVTREKVFLRLHQELPYSIHVETEKWEERPDGSARIDQVVYVQRDSQKPIVLGKGGRQIKAIGEAARSELEQLLERRIHLFIHVKVRGNWLEERAAYREMGLDYEP
ncbi:MAG: GTPase Era [Rhodospirillales bacterium]|nr:GTPase Era [Rhodospirillales bacterium]